MNGALLHNPPSVVWHALERHDCDPRGAAHRFTAKCPAHDDRNPSLSGGVGADGRVLVHCHRGCDPSAIVRALGLDWCDLFPPGHRHARRIPGVAAQRHPLDLVLEALRELGIRYCCTKSTHLWVAERCPACGADEHFPLWVQEDNRGSDDDHGGPVRLSCFNGCEQTRVLAVLAGVDEAAV